ncbi:MAG: GNAT family N-acetyltransferase [Spirochaetaceae bacterium]|nr:GNAT family N-acetyltransferase [Spirochaetaceae bacterium]
MAMFDLGEDSPAEGNYDFTTALSDAEIGECGRLFAASVSRHYIAMGDLRADRLDERLEWRADLAEELEREIRGASGDVNYVAVRGRGGEGIVAILVVALNEGNKSAELGDLVVRKDWRGRGLGELVLRWLEAALRKRGFRRIVLESGAGNEAAHAFFERQGFSPLAVEFVKEI